MGLNQGTRTNRIYLNIIQGNICRRVDADTPEAEKRYSEKLQKDVYELVYPSLTGFIRNMKIASTEFGDVLEIEVQDVDEKFVLNIQCESRYFNSFCNKIKNINFSQELMLAPYDFESKNEVGKNNKPKKITGINIYQPAKIGTQNKVQNYFGKDSKDEGQPRLKENYTEAQLKIFFVEQQEFYKNLVNEYAGRLVSEQDVKDEFSAVARDYVGEQETIANDSDLPF